MTTGTVAGTVPGPARTGAAEAPGARPAVDRFRAALWCVVAVQAVWLAVLMSRGWYYEADFSNLAAPTGRALTWSYLTASQGGHLDPFGRLVFWLLNRTAPLNHPATIVLRMVGQAVATVLLARLLVLLNGRRPSTLVVLALYAASPLLVQSTLWLTAAVSFQLSQIFVLVGLLAHVRHVVTGRLRYAAVVAAAFLAATLASEQAAVSTLALPLISFGFLHAGPPARRLRAVLADWREWIMIAVPILVFVAFFLGSGTYTANSGVSFSPANALRAVGEHWVTAVGPGLLGGPFTWHTTPQHAFGLSNPAPAVQIAATVLLVAAVAVSVRRTGARALVGWAIPATVSAVGIVVVSVGRFDVLGLLIARQFEHAAYTAAPAAVGICLAFGRTTPAAIAARVDTTRPRPAGPDGARRRKVRRWADGTALAGAATAVLIASSVSAAEYAGKWSAAPGHRYVDTLARDLHAAGPTGTLFNGYLPGRVVPGVVPYRRVSDLLRLMGVRADFGPSTRPRMVDAHGHVVTARFFTAAQVAMTGGNAFCHYPVHDSDRTDRWSRRAADGVVRLSYFQAHPSIVYVTLLVGHREVAPIGGARVLLRGNFGPTYLQFKTTGSTAIRIRSAALSTSVCITSLSVGFPFTSGRS